MKKNIFTLAVAIVLMVAVGTTFSQDVESTKMVSVKKASVSPQIDGVIEELWQQADSVSDFVQNQPYENAQPSEKTVVYLMQDDENLYVAFRCYAQNHPPMKSYTKDEDYVAIGIDPMGSQTGGYFFWQYASGIFWDGMYTDDGRTMDLAWEGVWYQAVKVHPDRMEVEFKIPFKTIRYKKGLSEWGMQLRRHIARNFEDDFWSPVPQRNNDLISRWGKMAGIDPQSFGYYFEMYPEGFLRNDKYAGLKSEAKPRGSMTVKWDVTPQTTINATAYPDFAQIESDQFSLNLSRYPRYLQEQRPFFVDGQDVFRLSSFGNGDWFSPLNIFYSRNIGRSIGGEAVQILGGGKLTHKTSAWNLGLLAAFTDSYSDDQPGTGIPQRRFGALRTRYRILSNSEIGFLASGTSASASDYNYSTALEAVFRNGPNQMIVQGAFSDRNGKAGWAGTAGYRGFSGPLLTIASAEIIDDSFDVSDVGFVPWAGRRKLTLAIGPYWTYNKGALRSLVVTAGGSLKKLSEGEQWSKIGSVNISPMLRRNLGGTLIINAGRNYEADTNYLFRSMELSTSGILFGNNFEAGLRYAYEYNYSRGYLGYNGSNYVSASYSLVSPLCLTMLTNLWMEWDPTNKIVASWTVIRPRLDFRITPTMTLSAFNEMVFLAPEARLGSSEQLSNRVGGLFSWNFAPKSWIYIALNDYQAQDADGFMKPQYTISAFKAKYLLYF